MTETVLKIYLAPSGQWAGIVFDRGEEVARIAGCSSAEEVEQEAYQQFDIDRVEVD
jgi:hypothetical protein